MTTLSPASRRHPPSVHPRLRVLLSVLLGAFALGGCVATPATRGATAATASLLGDAARPTTGQGWLRSELYFGVGLDGEHAEVDGAHWRDFLDREVTPRFPDGLTVIDAYGQWLSRGQDAPGRLKSKQLVILHPDTAEYRSKIEAIRLAWKQETKHQSVLWSWQQVGVSF